MASKWSGKIGFVFTEENPEGSGVWKERIVVKPFHGDVNRVVRRWQPGDKVNDDIQLNNEISVTMNSYLKENFYAVRFISFMHSWWKVNTVTMDYPRFTLEIGGVYNGDTNPTTE